MGWVDMSRVDIPAINGSVSGYGWSEHYGWIDFNAVYREGDFLRGWAIIKSISDAGANNGGWIGMIKMGNEPGDTYGVNVTKMDGTGANPTYAWSDELGWLDFSRVSGFDPVFKVDLTADAGIRFLSVGQTASDLKTKLTWTIAGSADHCEASGASWTGLKSPTGGTEEITLSSAENVFTLNCYDKFDALLGSDNVSVGVFCVSKKCVSAKCENEYKLTSTYICEVNCNNDSECSSLPIQGGWKEVVP